MPTLRRMVEQLLTELRYATSNQEREECIKLLTALVHAADAQGQRYVGDILQAIVSQIDSAPAQLASKLLDMVTALVRVSGSEVEPFYDELLASIVRALSSRSPSAAKRLAALRALSSCASYGDMAIAPYEECPHLFDLLATILKDSSDPLMHAEALRAVGALGAIDPHRFKNALARAANGAQMAAGGRRRERGLRKQGRALLNEMTAFRSERPDTELAGAIPAGYDGSEFTTDTYFTGIAVGALLGILNDATNRQPHREAAQALTSMFMSLKADAEPYAEQSLEAILAAMACPATGSAHMEFYIKRIQQLVEVAPRTLLLHLPTLCRLFSTEDLGCRRQQAMSLELLKTLATELPGEFGQHIAMVVSYLIAVIDRDDCESRALTRNALSAVQVLSWLLGDHQFLFVPRLLALMDTARQSDETVAASLQCLEVLAMATNCGSFVSRIVLTLVRLLQSVPAVEVQEAIFGVLCALMEQLQDQFMQFVPTIAAVVNRRGVSSNARYVRSMQLLLEGRLVPREPPRRQPRLRESDGDARAASRQDVDLGQLRRAWTPSRDMSEENGMRWLDNLTRVLLQQSPHVSLRACSGLATRHVQLGHSLFNAAFVSCWKALSDEHQKEIAASLQSVASNQGAPTAVLQTILSLAEYMERDNEHLPIDNALLATYARRCHALAKELYYVEAAWAQGANYAAMIKLIELNQSLDLRDSAIGVLDYVHKEHSDIKDTVECYQRLQRWDDALTMYRNQADGAGHDLAHGSTMGQIHCLFALSDWGALVQMYNRIRDSNDRDLQLKSAGFGVRMAWATSDIGRMEAYLAEQPTSSGEKSFYNALLAVHQRRTSDAAEHIAQARKAINVGQLLHIAHSDIHGYAQMFQCQMLTELEEIIEFKNDGCTRERQENLIQAWNTRLGGMRQDVAKWQRALRLRSLALRPILDVDTWVALANMSRHSGDMKVARAAIDRLLNDEAEYFTEVLKNPGDFAPRVLEQAREYARLKEEMILPSRASSPQPAAQAASWRGGVRRSSIPCGLLDKEVWLSQHPAVVYTYLKYKWAKGECADALKMLRWYAQDQSERLGFDPRNPSAYKAGANADAGEAALLARLYYRQAEWAGSVLSQQSWRGAAAESNGRGPRFQRSNTGELEAQRTHEDGPLFYETENDDADGSILESYRAATALHRKWYKAWHALALRHYLVVQRCEMTKVPITDAIAKQHAVPAVNAFFRAIQLSQGDSSPQDTLRLLLVWFKYSHIESVAQTVQDKVDRVPIRTWLQVIPQILAQININSPRIRQQVKMLLVSIGKRYPQAILFPVYVVARSHIQERKQAATDVIGSIYNRQPELVQQTECVSRELIHATLLLPERWNDALDKAWKGYQARQSDTSILAVLEAIHKATRNPATPYDRYFMRKFGQEIGAAENIVAQCLAEVDPQRRHELLDSVWAHYYHLTQRIGAELSKLRVVSFEDTAPALLTYNNLLLAIPGTYRPDEEPVTIQSIDPMVEIHKTLRRPRQMSMRGSDGVKYTFLLKGGEDLRQDERVMQLFGLVNSLLARDKDTSQRSLAIERFPVVPLSSSSGLIGFYPNCQSIQKLIECYRHAHEVPLYLEWNLSRQFAPNYTTLTIAQKIELFEHVQSETPGDDLQRIMWYRSPSSEEWLTRRTNYTRSLAVMSMVGYILGLGDRHLNNILIHERTGRVVHIDLGDCFETAAHRDMFPETIPFRLTRMLIKPMGVTALEGAFKRSAHYTMRVLRANRDSMMAVLEAFVFDPLMTWVVIREPEESADRASSSQQQQQPKQQEQRQQRDDRLAHSMVGKDGAAGTTWFRQVARIGEVGANTYIAPDHRRQGGNPRALAIVKRIHDKLVGCDFDRNIRLGETKQIDKLIQQATSVENLAVLFKGWGPDW
ncbi:phosphatidylinositol kinase- protein kinase tor1 [Coemansia spiralis]|nr:phosphatidylinositol kinase- protein kinase tor1 [Coemansia spiralis]